MTTPTLAAETETAVRFPPAGVPVEPRPLKSQRLVSLDIFRGITIAAMLLVNNMSDPKYAPFEHADWHGWTPTDLIFPFFLFIVGVAIPFSFARRSATTEQTRAQLLGRVWLRALSLFMLGELLAGFSVPAGQEMPHGFWGTKIFRVVCFIFVYASIIALLVPWKSKRFSTWIPIVVTVLFYLLLISAHYVNRHALAMGWPAKVAFGRGILDPDHLRIPGVLQRIGVVYGIAGSIALFAGWRMIVTSIVLLFAIYSALMLKAPYPGHTVGSLTQEDNLARHIDIAVFTRPHTYGPYPDNEGLLSTIPAIGTALLGILVGLWLRTPRPAIERCAGILAMGVPVLIFGYCLNWWLMPINKNLWTPSYVLFTGGLAMLGLGFLYWLVDVLGRRRGWTLPFVIFGMNAIAAFVAAAVVPRLLNLIKIHPRGSLESVGLMTFLHNQVTNGLHRTSDAIVNISPHMPVLFTPENNSLAYALFFMVLIFVLMTVLYVSKIFVKV